MHFSQKSIVRALQVAKHVKKPTIVAMTTMRVGCGTHRAQGPAQRAAAPIATVQSVTHRMRQKKNQVTVL